MKLEDSLQADFTYGSYLKIPELLSLQQCVSVGPETDGPEHDEMLFIIIHQVYELWFKQILHEVDFVAHELIAGRVGSARHHLRRVLKIMKTLVGQIDVLETLTPAEFASFRSFLSSASGFQSVQFRELEFSLGLKDRVQLDWFFEHDRARLEKRYQDATLWDAFLAYSASVGVGVPAELLERDATTPVVANADLQAAIVERYSNEQFAGLCEALTDLDEGLQEWRYRHVMMVRRTIGTKPGTGGSDGASYLQTTLFKPVFPDLWAIRAAF